MIKNTIYRLILNFYNLVIPIITGMYVARLFSLESYGVFNSANADLSLFLILGSFGVYNYGIREVGRVQDNFEERKKVASSLFLISVFSNILALILFILYTIFFVNGDYTFIYFILCIQIIANIFNVEWINEGTENFKFITIKTVIIRTFYVFFLFVFVKSESDLWIYTLLLSLSTLINNMISFLRIKNTISLKKNYITIFKYLKPLIVMMLIININYMYTQLDKLVISKINGDIATSYFHIPHYIINTIFTLISSIIIVSIPRLSLYVEKGEEKKYVDLINSTTDFYFFCAIPIFIGIAAISKDVMVIYGGIKYEPAYLILIAAAFYKIIASLEFIIGHQVMYIQNRHDTLMKMFLVGGIINVFIILFLFYLDVFNPFTATVGTTIAESIVLMMLIQYTKSHFKYSINFFSKNKGIYLLSSLFFFPISSLLNGLTNNFLSHSIITIIICIIFYMMMLLITKDHIFLIITQSIKEKVKKE